MTKHQWGRSQKYRLRPRQLYALLFDNGCAYIGQSVDIREREMQHRRPAGGWQGQAFQCVLLGEIEGTEEQAKEYEHAWRHRAAVNGWRIYAKPPGMVVNHRNQMTFNRYWLGCSLRWPTEHSRNLAWRLLKWAGMAAVLASCFSRWI